MKVKREYRLDADVAARFAAAVYATRGQPGEAATLSGAAEHALLRDVVRRETTYNDGVPYPPLDRYPPGPARQPQHQRPARTLHTIGDAHRAATALRDAGSPIDRHTLAAALGVSHGQAARWLRKLNQKDQTHDHKKTVPPPST